VQGVREEARAATNACNEKLYNGNQQHTDRRDLYSTQSRLVAIQVGIDFAMLVPMSTVAMTAMTMLSVIRPDRGRDMLMMGFFVIMMSIVVVVLVLVVIIMVVRMLFCCARPSASPSGLS